MFFQIKNYFSFLFHSTNKYGVHSPFVYNLIMQCFETKLDTKKSNQIKAYKAKLLNQNNTINVTDFGAGSRVFKTNKRKISAIAKNAGITTKRAKLLVNFVAYFKFENILEIGTSLGMGTHCLSLGNLNAKITTLEGCPETLRVAKESLESFNIDTINFVAGDFNKTLKKVLVNTTYNLIYIDGNHQKEPTIAYFEACLKAKNEDSVFIFDDIHWSQGMNEAWQFIKNHEEVTLTIDTFFWGFVFFRKEQFQKEHFKIRL